MKGDRVEIVVDSGSGVLTYEIEATKAGGPGGGAASRGGGRGPRRGRHVAGRDRGLRGHEERGAGPERAVHGRSGGRVGGAPRPAAIGPEPTSAQGPDPALTAFGRGKRRRGAR